MLFAFFPLAFSAHGEGDGNSTCCATYKIKPSFHPQFVFKLWPIVAMVQAEDIWIAIALAWCGGCIIHGVKLVQYRLVRQVCQKYIRSGV